MRRGVRWKREPGPSNTEAAAVTPPQGRWCGGVELGRILEDLLARAQSRRTTNFLGTVYVTKAAVPILREQGGGRIIQISSLGGRIGSLGMTAYQSAKWAVGGFSEALAAEVAPLGIKVTVVEPGGMRTDWAGSSMTTPPISQPYQATVGASARAMNGFEHVATSDPRKVARLVLTIAELDEPPLRILAGSDAYEYGREAWRSRIDREAWRSRIGREAWRSRIETDATWERLSSSTDHDEAGDTWQQQRGTSLPDLRP